MILAVDSGNTRLKYGLFHGLELVSSGQVSNEEAISCLSELILKHEISHGILSSVKKQQWISQLSEQISLPFQKANIASKFSFKIQYDTPETIGIDRLIACEGALSINKNEGNLLVIDAGTCITYDFLDSNLNYQGGIISPGLKIRAQGMNNYTDNLPLVPLNDPRTALIGKSTVECLKSGILNGALAEMNGIIEQFQSQYPNLKIFLTGGDLIFFENGLKSGIFAEPNLTLVGLARLAAGE